MRVLRALEGMCLTSRGDAVVCSRYLVDRNAATAGRLAVVNHRANCVKKQRLRTTWQRQDSSIVEVSARRTKESRLKQYLDG